MNVWPIQDAQARFDELLQTCRSEGPQMVTELGAEAAVLVPIAEWRRMLATRPSLKELLLSDENRMDIPLPSRGRHRRRPPPELE